MLIGLEQSEQLSKWPKRRIRIEATVSRVGEFYDAPSRANVPSYLLANVEIREDEQSEVIGKIWCAWAGMLKKAGIRAGDLIRCTVQTYQFQKRDRDDPNKTQQVWGIREARDVQCLSRSLDDPDTRPPMRLPIPPAATNGTAPKPPADPDPPAAAPADPPDPPAPPPAAPADPRRELFFALDDLAARYGLPMVRKVLAAVELVRDDRGGADGAGGAGPPAG